jgi:hypothetical protein
LITWLGLSSPLRGPYMSFRLLRPFHPSFDRST